MAQIKTYLAGTIQDSKDGGVSWRKKITPKLEELGIKVLDPTILESEEFGSMVMAQKVLESYVEAGNRDLFVSAMETNKSRDLAAVREASFLIVKGHETGGTICEMWEMLRHHKKPVYVIANSDLKKWNYWMLSEIWKGGGEIFNSESELFAFLKGRYYK